MSIHKKKKKRIIKKGRRCYYCGILLKLVIASIDHKLPKSKGGLHTHDNLVACCKPCNEDKADRDVEGYRQYLRNKKPRGFRVVFYGELSWEDQQRFLVRNNPDNDSRVWRKGYNLNATNV